MFDFLPACRIKGKAKDAVETKSKEVRAWPRVSLSFKFFDTFEDVEINPMDFNNWPKYVMKLTVLIE